MKYTLGEINGSLDTVNQHEDIAIETKQNGKRT